MSGQPAQTLATHLLNQTLSSIAILETLNVINASDAHLIRSKLPSPTGPFPSLAAPLPAPAPQDLAQSFGGLSVNPTNAYAQNQPTSPQQHYQSPTHSFQPPPAPAPPSLPPRARSEQRAKALWDYSGAEPDDLAFRQGDTLIIDEEVNEQWYRGRVIPQGQQYPLDRGGLFPSNYIEKIQSHSAPYYPSSPNQMVPYQPPGPPQTYGYEKPQGNYNPPPPQHMAMVPQQPHQQQLQQQQQQAPQTVVVAPQDEKKSKFGKIGGQLGHAAVNGAGFGFGASIASEMVHKIF
ncbi:SH3 domain-containing protein [Papiliotrema laurentii]|uniref:SH3 domain-containing protein n=1 Tax=Papiliotrema laurentii TaxID=5418 RepID=A0AAD9FP31_PAPLA|nr:SH3 domain-containing protein [Papiliotrema laurentii]